MDKNNQSLVGVANTASPRRTLRRVMGKFFQFVARKVPFIPNKMRVMLQKLHGVQFANCKTVFLGENVYFDDIYPGAISVGHDVRITAGVRILSHYLDTKFVPTPQRPFRFYCGKVQIGNNVFIGANSIIVKPVIIGDGAIIGANSVITSDVPPNSIVVGSPARVVGKRPV